MSNRTCGQPSGCQCARHCPQPTPPCHQDQCRCGQCDSWGEGGRRLLLPRVLAVGREWRRKQPMLLCVEGLPECAEGPFMLMSVWTAGEAEWKQEMDAARRQICLAIRIPLLCQVRDCRGCMYCARAWAEVDAAVHVGGHMGECWRSSMLVHPYVRLVCPPCASCDGCFDVLLEILAECYMVHWECCGMKHEPECPPPLPLYPPPRCE